MFLIARHATQRLLSAILVYLLNPYTTTLVLISVKKELTCKTEHALTVIPLVLNVFPKMSANSVMGIMS
jgi:hypothetical protein